MGDLGRDGGRGARARGAGVLGLALALAACGRPTPPAATATTVRVGGDAVFLSPPTLIEADRAADGGVRLSGRAPPDAVVRLQAPDGRALGVTADAAGAWSATLPPTAAPAFYAFSAELDGRTLRGEGALAAGPPGAGATALVARAGAAAAVAVTGPPPVAPVLQAVDFDGGGGIAAAGRAAPGAALKLMVDGAAVGEGAADAAGRFGLPGVRAPLAPGVHRVRVEAAAGAAEASVDTSPALALDGAPFHAARTAGGWRVDWSPPGGGVQSLVWLDATSSGAASARAPR